jgi:hypothetical protein
MGAFTLLLVGAAVAAGSVALVLSLGHKKSETEKERERRLKINAKGRICDGTIEKVTETEAPGGVGLLYYSYTVGGVTYSAAQDLSMLPPKVSISNCIEGFPISVKYDPQDPSSSIVICELWSGLR